jgi:hypothetical protein
MNQISESRIVAFVHLGESKPEHLFPNMIRVRKQIKNTDIQLFLIATSEDLLLEANRNGFQGMKYETNLEIQSLLSEHEKVYDHDFRRGFWRYSIERLFAVGSIFDRIEDAKVLHIESDILTFPNFPYNVVFSLDKSTWGKLNEESDVGSLIYLPSREESNSFRTKLIEVLSKNISLTDMSALARLGKENPKICYFPIAEGSNSRYLNPANISQLSSERMSDLYSNFNGIFDSAAIGMFELGQDPRNNWGFIKRGVELAHSGIFAERYQLFLTDKGNLKTSEGIDVFCLHAHAKEVRLFEENGNEYLKRILNRRNTKFSKTSFSLHAFLDLISDYGARGKLLVLFMNLPLMKKLRQNQLITKFENRLRK